MIGVSMRVTPFGLVLVSIASSSAGSQVFESPLRVAKLHIETSEIQAAGDLGRAVSNGLTDLERFEQMFLRLCQIAFCQPGRADVV